MSNFIFLVDLDGTLTRDELLPLIAQKFNLEESIKDLTYQCIKGKIPFQEGFLRRIKILKSIPISHIQSVIESVDLNENLVSFMQDNAERCYIVTGNLDVWVKPLCKKLKIASYTSIAKHKDNFIQGVRSVLNKKKVIEQLRHSFPVKKFVAIGEGHNDAELIESADLGIAYGGIHEPANSVMGVASHAIFDEKILCDFLKQLS